MSLDLGTRTVKSEINVTPLVDVVLVLLIIFMVITPMLQRGKPVTLPEAKVVSRLTAGGDPIYVSMTAEGRIYLDKREVQRAELAQALSAEVERAPGAPVLLKADRAVDYKAVREVVVELSKAHLTGVSLAASESKERR